MITTKLETITPTLAKSMLLKMIANRPLSESKSLEYAMAIDEGRWIINGETIKFDDEDRLFDGQHRLQACVLAEKAFSTYVVRGIHDKMAFATVDVGKTRTHGDIFGVAGYPSSSLASGAAMVIYLYKNDMLSATGVTGRRYSEAQTKKSAVLQKLKTKQVRSSVIQKEDLLKFCEPFKERLIEAVRFAERTKSQKLVSRGSVAGLYFLFSEKSQVDAQRFFADLCEGIGLSGSDPVYRLRERMIANKDAVHKLTRFALMFLIAKAWVKRRNGEKVGTLKIVEGEKFPKIC